MSTYISQDIRDALDAARLTNMKKISRLRVVTPDGEYPVLRSWRGGFSVETEQTPRLRGLVDIYDGLEHLYQCLVVVSEEDGGETSYEFKRSTLATTQAPADFYRDPMAPVALIGEG